MFDSFRKNLQRKMLLLISVILLVHYIVIMVVYTGIIKRDFRIKTYAFSSRYAANIETRMDSIENQASIFMRKYADNMNGRLYSTDLSMALRRVKSYSTDILGAFVCTDGSFAYFSDSEYSMWQQKTSKFLDSVKSGNAWLCLKDGSSFKIFYCMKLSDNVLIIDVKPEMFCEWNTNNLFFENSAAKISFATGNRLLVSGNTVATEIDSFDKQYNNHLRYKRQLSEKNVEITTYVSEAVINNRLYGCGASVAVIMVAFIAFAAVAVHKLAKRLSETFTGLCNKMERFSQNPKQYHGGDEDD